MSLIFKFIFLGIILFKIINCVIDEIGKSLELSECFLYLLHRVCPSEKIIGNKIRTDKLSALQIINIFKIFRESLGSCFHEVLSHYRKIFFEFGVFYNGDILFHIVINGLADSFQYIGRQTQASSGKHTSVRLQMHIVSAMIGLLAFGIDITAKMYLIGCLIRREAGIPINTIGTIFGLDSPDCFIEQRNAGDYCCQKVIKLGTGYFIF